MTARRAAALAVLVAVSPLVAGCLGTLDEPLEEAATTEALTGNALSWQLTNLSEPIEGVTLETSLLTQFRIPALDGVELDTWIVRPPVDEPVPLVLEVTPYYGGGPPVLKTGDGGLALRGINTYAQTLLEHGYAVGISSVRGTGNSGGCFTLGGPTEAQDTAAVIEHLAAEAWSNGKIGLMGVSYPGTTPQDVWVEAPPALKTIVPISGISDMYRYNFVNGVPIDIQGFGFNTYYWAMVGVSPAGLAGGAQAGDPLGVPGAVAGEACEDQLEVQEGGVSSTLDGNKDAFWQARDFHAELRDSWDRNGERASVFYIHGLQDWNVKPHMMEEWLPAVQESGVPFKAWLGQWAHAWPQREDWGNATLLAWFDQFLKGHETGILDVPAVQVQDDDGRWRHEETWPPEDVVWQKWHLHLNKRLDREGPGDGSLSYYDGRGEPQRLMGLPVGERSEAIVWKSDVLAEDLTLSGMPKFVGDVTVSGSATAALVLTLAEEEADGTLRPINYAVQSLNHVGSLESGDPDVDGDTLSVKVLFFPQDDVVHKGSRLVLVAAGNTWGNGPGPAVQPITDGATLTIDLSTAALKLPVDVTLEYEDPQPCWEEDCYVIR